MKALIVTDFHRGFDRNVSIIQDKAYSEIDQTTFDLIIVSGDWGTSSIDHVKGAFRFFRRMFPSKIICGVLGNHDLWDKKVSGLNNRFSIINRYAKESNIHLLENNPLELDNYTILGFNGWFSDYDYDNCNDINHMLGKLSESDYLITQVAHSPYNYQKRVSSQSQDIFNDWCKILLNKEAFAINSIIKNESNKKKIVVTHLPIFEQFFESNPKWAGSKENGNKLIDCFDFHIFGHTHNQVIKEDNNKVFINAGAIYGKATYIIYDFDSKSIIKNFFNIK
jgi:predicted phosphodiesterase